jgi:hypothetical protein
MVISVVGESAIASTGACASTLGVLIAKGDEIGNNAAASIVNDAVLNRMGLSLASAIPIPDINHDR